MNWQDIIKEELDLKSGLKTLSTIKNPQSARVMAKAIEDEIKKKAKVPNGKPEEESEEEKIIKDVAKSGMLTPERKRQIEKMK